MSHPLQKGSIPITAEHAAVHMIKMCLPERSRPASPAQPQRREPQREAAWAAGARPASLILPYPQVTLMSRDEASMLVVSYADVKRCVEGAFGELRARAVQSRARPLARR